ncbi:hypothetical protein, partial [Hymenobacter sp.]|uniref:hypothetical protein n=1 Tax=Hymenobacter sp. TaxID=1898978 RepID=UPI002ED77A25
AVQKPKRRFGYYSVLRLTKLEPVSTARSAVSGSRTAARNSTTRPTNASRLWWLEKQAWLKAERAVVEKTARLFDE